MKEQHIEEPNYRKQLDSHGLTYTCCGSGETHGDYNKSEPETHTIQTHIT